MACALVLPAYWLFSALHLQPPPAPPPPPPSAVSYLFPALGWLLLCPHRWPWHSTLAVPCRAWGFAIKPYQDSASSAAQCSSEVSAPLPWRSRLWGSTVATSYDYAAPIAEDAKLSDVKYALRRAKVARAAAELSELLGFSESN